MLKEKAKGSPRQRYGLWLFFGLLIGTLGAFMAFLGLYEPRRDMVFAETSQITGNESIYFADYSPDWQTIYTQSSSGQFRIWDTRSGNIAQLASYENSYTNLQWNPEKTHFLSIDYENAAILFDKLGNRITAYQHEGVYMALWNPLGNRVITISQTESKLWTVDAHLLQVYPQPMVLFDAALWSPDSSRFFAWDNDVEATVLDADGNVLNAFSLSGFPTAYAWNSTSSAFAISQYIQGADPAEFRVVVYDANGKELWEERFEGDAPQILWNPDGTRLTIFNYVPEAQSILYSIEGERLASLVPNSFYLWHPDGEILLSATTDGHGMQLVDKNGNLLKILAHDSDTSYTYPQWSPNGEILATWGRQAEASIYTLYLWDKAGNLLHQMSESTPIEFVVWSPDSSRILTVGSFVARIWSVEGGEINSLNHSRPLTQALWSSDGSRILTVGAYMSSVDYENAIWTSEGDHLATLFTGDNSRLYVAAWRDDFSQVIVMMPTGLSIRSLQADPIYFDFRFDND